MKIYSFWDLLKSIRKEWRLTQKEIASILWVSKILITLIETEKKEPSKAFIIVLSKKLNVNPISITPFLFSTDNNDLNFLEKKILNIWLKLQEKLIKTKSKELIKYIT